MIRPATTEIMSSKTPRYLDVAASLDREISMLAPNCLLPTEQQLAKRFGVSRVTVRVALDLLERNGMVSRLRGRGTTVSPPKITRRFFPWHSFEQDLKEQGIDYETRILFYEPQSEPPTSFASACARQRTRPSDSCPWCASSTTASSATNGATTRRTWRRASTPRRSPDATPRK